MRLMALLIVLLIPTAAMAKGECKQDKQKFCQDVIEATGDVGACLKQHTAELSEACKALREAKAKKPGEEKNAEDSAKMGKEQSTNPEPAPAPSGDATKE